MGQNSFQNRDKHVFLASTHFRDCRSGIVHALIIRRRCCYTFETRTARFVLQTPALHVQRSNSSPNHSPGRPSGRVIASSPAQPLIRQSACPPIRLTLRGCPPARPFAHHSLKTPLPNMLNSTTCDVSFPWKNSLMFSNNCFKISENNKERPEGVLTRATSEQLGRFNLASRSASFERVLQQPSPTPPVHTCVRLSVCPFRTVRPIERPRQSVQPATPTPHTAQ